MRPEVVLPRHPAARAPPWPRAGPAAQHRWSCDTRAALPHCRGSRPRPSPDRAGWRSTRASPTTTRRRPADLGDLEELRAADKFRFANRLQAWIEVDDAGRITAGGYGGGGVMGASTVKLGCLKHTFQAVALPGPAARARGGRLVDALRPDDRRPDGAARAPAGAAAAVRPVAGAAGVDHAVPDPARRRPRRVHARGSQQVPPALGLRRRRRR